MPDEGKLPVSWLAGNQGEYATSTEVGMAMIMMVMGIMVIVMIMIIMMIMIMPKMVVKSHKEGDGVCAALAVSQLKS